jgi:hypothetical protein
MEVSEKKVIDLLLPCLRKLLLGVFRYPLAGAEISIRTWINQVLVSVGNQVRDHRTGIDHQSGSIRANEEGTGASDRRGVVNVEIARLPRGQGQVRGGIGLA